MKRKHVLWVLLGLLVLFSAVSCKSKPAPQEVPPPAPPPVESPVSPPAITPTDTSPDQSSLDALNRAAARAAAARQMVLDFEGPSFFPEDWRFAESVYAEAEQQRKTSSHQAVQESTLRYDRATATYESLFNKIVVEGYKFAETELTAVRNEAIAAGALALIPEYLQEIDNLVVSADNKYWAKDYYGARDTGLKAYFMYDTMTSGLIAYRARENAVAAGVEEVVPEVLYEVDEIGLDAIDLYFANNFSDARSTAEKAEQMYIALKSGMDAYNVRGDAVAAGAEELIPELLDQADNVGFDAIDYYLAGDYSEAKYNADTAKQMYIVLKSGLDAFSVREEITGRGFQVYDPQNFGFADFNLVTAAEDYMAKAYYLAKDRTDEALVHYNLALKTGWESFAAEKGADAATERQRALDLRANIASRQEFNSAQDVYTRANSVFQAKRLEEASTLYIQSRSMFIEVSRITLQKRQEAERALNFANQRIVESDETARNAELILEGGL